MSNIDFFHHVVCQCIHKSARFTQFPAVKAAACECDRQNDVQLGAVMSLLSGPSVAEAIGDPKNRIAEMARLITDDRALIDKLYLRVLNRMPSESETELVLDNWAQIEIDHQVLVDRLAKAESDWVYRKAELEGERLPHAVQTAIEDLLSALDKTYGIAYLLSFAEHVG